MRQLKLDTDKSKIGYVSIRGWAFGLTLLLSIAAIGVTFARGLNLGGDFVGGLSIEATFKQPPPIAELRSTIDAQHAGEAGLSPYVDNP